MRLLVLVMFVRLLFVDPKSVGTKSVPIEEFVEFNVIMVPELDLIVPVETFVISKLLTVLLLNTAFADEIFVAFVLLKNEIFVTFRLVVVRLVDRVFELVIFVIMEFDDVKFVLNRLLVVALGLTKKLCTAIVLTFNVLVVILV